MVLTTKQTSKGNGRMTAKKYHGCSLWWHIYVKVLRVRSYFCPRTLPVFRLYHLHISLFYFSHIDSSHHVVFLLFNNLQKGQNLLKQEADCRTIADMLKSRHVSLVNQLNTHSLSVTNQRWDKRVTETSLRSRRGWRELVKKWKTLEREWVMLLEVSTTLNKSTEAGGSQVWKSTRCYTYVTEWWRMLGSRWDSVLFIKQPWQGFICFLFSFAKKHIS